jgi:hypothetical protein
MELIVVVIQMFITAGYRLLANKEVGMSPFLAGQTTLTVEV